jgi:hypothetical protein
MAMIEATPVTDLQGGLLALALAIACLLLRAWLTSPRRGLLRVLLLPAPPATEDEPRDQEREDENDGLPHPQDRRAEPPKPSPAAPRALPMSARGVYDGRH